MPKIINYINLQNAQAFSYDTTVKDEVNLKNKKTSVGARLLYNDIFSHSFKIASNLPREELLIKIELKMYEDIGLDPNKAYKISYIKKSQVSDNEMLIEAFAVDKSEILQKYQTAFKAIKHVDFIAVPFLSFHTLYTNKLLTPKNDVFVYISDDEAFTTSYKDGKYISSKRIKSISNMLDELKQRDITLTAEELKEAITTKGLNKNSYELLQYDLHEYLVEIFEDLFSKIKNLSLHNRNVYSFEQIDQLYVSCDGKKIPSLEDYVRVYAEDAKFQELNFLQTPKVDTLDAITASYIKDNLVTDNHEHNLTFFDKKVPFYKSEVGKLALSAVASALILSAYPAYLQVQISEKNNTNEELKIQESKISSSSKKQKTKLKNLNDEIAKLKKEQSKDTEKLQTLQAIANSLLELKSKDTQYTSMFLKINKILQNYNLSIEKITQADTHALNLELKSKQNKRDTIALLMKDLLSSGFSSVTSGEITLSDDMYKSTVTVKR